MSRAPALLGALGLVALVFGFLNLIVGAFGAGIDPLWVGGNLAVGALLLAVAGVRSIESLRERLASGGSKRAGRYGSSAILSTLFAVAILWLLGFLATRYPVRFDWSEQKVHSLSDQTTKVLAGLQGDVKVLALYPAVDAQPVREILDRYAYASPRFTVEFADPSERPGPAREERHHGGAARQGARARCRSASESTQLTDVTEESLTNALVKLTRTSQKTVYFLEGHNERSLAGEAGTGKEGLARAADALKNERYEVEAVAAGVDGRGSGGRQRRDRRRGDASAARGGARGARALSRARRRAARDDRSAREDGPRGRPAELGGRRRRRHHRRSQARALRPRHDALREQVRHHPPDHEGSARDDALPRRAQRAPESGLEGGVHASSCSPATTRGPRPTSIASSPSRSPSSMATISAARSRSPSRARVDLSSAAAANPAAGTRLRPQRSPRASSSSATRISRPTSCSTSYRNRDLFLNSVNWLAGDVEAISIRPNRSRASRFQLSQEQFMTIRSLSLFVLPEAFGVLGVFTWWSRRRAPER